MAELISSNAEQRAFTAAAMNTLQCKVYYYCSSKLMLTTFHRHNGSVDSLGLVPTDSPTKWYVHIASDERRQKH
jgi:hypothetical protein